MQHKDKFSLDDIKRMTKDQAQQQDTWYEEGKNDIMLFGRENRVQIQCPTCKSYH